MTNSLGLVGKAIDPQPTGDIKTQYLETLTLVERLHRRLLDVIKDEFDRQGRSDLNAVQALLLYNIGNSELTAGELRTRGYYLGSNVSYNVKKMVENGYLIQERSVHDKRSIRVRLSDKGTDLRNMISDMFKRHEQTLSGTEITAQNLVDLNKTLKMLERFWAHQTNFSGGL